jgi:hypothetical protein
VGTPIGAVLTEVGHHVRGAFIDFPGQLGIVRIGDVLVEQLVRPGPEQLTVRDRQPKQLGDHRHGQRVGQRGDEVELAGTTSGVEQFAGHLSDAGSQPRDDFRAEGRPDQPAQRVVAWRIGPRQIALGELVAHREHPAHVRREHLRVRDRPRHVGVAEHVPDAVLVAPHWVLVAHLA